MKTGTKFAIAGASAGAVTAVLPAACGVYLSRKRKPLDCSDMLRAENGKFFTADNRETVLTGIDLSLPEIRCTKDTEVFRGDRKQVFDELASRFGNYGAREIFGRYFENHITKSDVKSIKGLGINCVRIPLSSYLLFRDGKLKKAEPDLSRADKLIEKFRKAGIYTILSLEYVPGFENGKEDLFVYHGRKGLDLRNEAVEIWLKIASHYKGNPAIAAYDILDRGSLGFEQNEDTANFYIRAVKALRDSDDCHIAIIQQRDMTAQQAKRLRDMNTAQGASQRYCSFLEAQSIAKSAGKISQQGTAAFVTNLRPSGLASALELFEGVSLSGIFTGYKGNTGCIYTGSGPLIDLALDTFDSINEKIAESCKASAYSRDKQLENELKTAAENIEFRKVISSPIKIHYSHGKAYSAGI